MGSERAKMSAMSLQKTLMKAATGYAIKKLTEEMAPHEARRYQSLAGEYARAAVERTPGRALDARQLSADIMRRAGQTRTPWLVAGGVVLGVAVGAGAAYLYTSPKARERLVKAIEDVLPQHRESTARVSRGETLDVQGEDV